MYVVFLYLCVMKYGDFFLNNNKSGHKTKEIWLRKNNPDLYNIIISNTNQDIPFIEKIYLFIHELNETPKCPQCGELVKFKGTLQRGYNNHCSINCLNKSKEHKEKILKTTIKKYGVHSHNQLTTVKEKKRKTLQINYGVDNPMKSNEIKERYRDNFNKNHGVNNPMKIDRIRNKFKNNVYIGDEKNVNRVINKLKDKYRFIKHENGDFHFMCLKCNETFNINANLLNSRFTYDKPICLNCNPKKSYETLPKILVEDLHDIDYEFNNRTEIKKEIDIYFPSYKLGIEVNGLYWHSEIYKDKYYHLNKTILCQKQGIQLLQVFEDEILNKPQIVKSIIKSKLGIIEYRIYARKCQIREINDNKLIRNFLETNHIQGFVGSNVKIGLYYNDELVSIMTFGKKRLSMGNKLIIDNEYEMLRFCNKLNTVVIGGASKMLNYFIKTYNPKSILTFADRRYSNGGLYEKLGFEFIDNTRPNYYYYKCGDMKRHYRFKFRKDILIKEGYNPDKTEHQIMNERGYFKIYDCGNLKFIMNV